MNGKFFQRSCVTAAFIAVFSACSSDQKSETGVNHTPVVQGPVIPAGSIPKGESQIVTLPNGAEIVVENRGGVHFFRVEATFTDEKFGSLMSSTGSIPRAERAARLDDEIQSVFRKLKKARAVGLSRYPEVGYFTAILPYPEASADGQVVDILGALKSIDLGNSVIFNPMITDRDAVYRLRAAQNEGRASSSPRDSTEHYSGLERMGIPEFISKAEKDIGDGTRVNGSSVRLGITDTGITLNHPSYTDSSGKSRIKYLRDFTAEGRMYFHPAAKFDVEVPVNGAPDDLLITAQVIATPKLPALPAGDRLISIPQFRAKVSSELKAILTKPGNGAKLGVLIEDVFQNQAGGELADLNNNGKLDDKILVILIPGATPDQDVAYVDPSGTGDFRNSKALGNWNNTQASIELFAERAGFDFDNYELPTEDGSAKVQVRGASIVGYDPGNHGSHVAGIAAGRKTIANDVDETLARGTAPDAEILMNRVCSNNFGCNAVEALVDMAVRGGAEVINMSLGGLNPFNDGYGVQEVLINRLTFLKNTLFVISAGNSGPGRQTVGSPSVARMSLSVGASASRALIERQYGWPGLGGQAGSSANDDFLLFFTSRGPSASGGFKPNVVAPGTELSAIQLNTAPGARGGLDVYWGTSMSAPAATGAYALLLDAVKKFNLKHPGEPLAADSVTLRRVLIETARPFDVESFSPESGKKTKGQYTWIDQGKGMVNLPAAWSKLFEMRNDPVQSPVARNGKPVQLDYEIIVPMVSPAGVPYDGSRPAMPDVPAFGTGVYLDFYGNETLRQVHVARKLPFHEMGAPDAGHLTMQLLTTGDEFVLDTTIYGSDQQWLKAGVLDRLGSQDGGCAAQEAANLMVLGRGVEVSVSPEGKGTVVPSVASTLQLCIDRKMVSETLKPGDHGAIISAYRVVGGRKAAAPSFEVPVYLAVPHKTLNDSTSYVVSGSIRSFGVSRNYVTIPGGTSVVRVTLEVPALKTDSNGNLLAGEQCSGVELMGLQGSNIGGLFPSRVAARATNCDAQGRPINDLKARKVVFSTTSPKAGTWDMHLFGVYKYALSHFELRVDYVTADTSVGKVEGGLQALNGNFQWIVKSASIPSVPDGGTSGFVLNGLFASAEATVANGEFVIAPGPLGELREYPTDVKSVTITTGGSTGNDLDLMIFECDPTLAAADACKPVASSAGPTDQEAAKFVPKAGMKYAARVDGFTVKDNGKFTTTETLGFDDQAGKIEIVTAGQDVSVHHSMPEEQLTKGVLHSELFLGKKYDAVGSIVLRTPDKMVLGSIPVRIRAE